MKTGTVALIVRQDEFTGEPAELIENLSDDHEIAIFEASLGGGDLDPLGTLASFRNQTRHEDEEFADYVENLIAQPCVKPEVLENGVQWLKSKIKIESYRKKEIEAAKVIADFAYKLYREDPKRLDFFLDSPRARVRVRVFILGEELLGIEDDGRRAS